LWADLDPNVLTEGVESYLKEFRKFTKAVSFFSGARQTLPIKQSFSACLDFHKITGRLETTKAKYF